MFCTNKLHEYILKRYIFFIYKSLQRHFFFLSSGHEIRPANGISSYASNEEEKAEFEIKQKEMTNGKKGKEEEEKKLF